MLPIDGSRLLSHSISSLVLQIRDRAARGLDLGGGSSSRRLILICKSKRSSLSCHFTLSSRVRQQGDSRFGAVSSRSATVCPPKPYNQNLVRGDELSSAEIFDLISGKIGHLMNLRRSRSVRLLSPNSPMSPPAISTVYCCVAKGRKVIYFYNNAGQELETLAAECLQNAPVFHYWYSHTAEMRTFGFLIADGYTYFAIVDPSAGSFAVLTFLENIRAAFRKSPRKELISVIEHLVSTLKCTPRSSFLIRDDNGEGSDASPSTDRPLLENDKHQSDRRSEEDEDGMVIINMPKQQEVQNLSSNRPRSQPLIGYKLWWRHVKLVVSADIILCLVLFSIWLAACNGFHCVSK